MSEIKNPQELKTKLLKKALTDAGFKKALLANPNAAIEKELVGKLPAGIKIKVVEYTASEVHLVLPEASRANKGELSDTDLNK